MNKSLNYTVLLKTLGVWLLFILALSRLVEPFDSIRYVHRGIIPGAAMFLFYIYFGLKTGTYLQFPLYLLSSIVVLICHHLVWYATEKWLRLYPVGGFEEKFFLDLTIPLVIAVVLWCIYLVFRTIFSR